MQVLQRKCRIAWWFTKQFCGDLYEAGIERLKKYHHLIDELLPCWYCVNSDGHLVQIDTYDHIREITELCGSLGIRMIPLINPPPQGGLQHMLSDEKMRQEHIKRILDLVERNDFIGIDVDYEGLPRDFKQLNTEFFAALGTEMKAANKILSYPVQPKTNDTDPTVPGASAQDYKALSQYIDNLRVMCYDQHHPVYSPPGPVGGAKWATRVMEYALTMIPREKLYMGLPVYGHEWDLSGKGKHRYVSHADSEQVAANYGIKVLWDEQEGAPHFNYVSAEGPREIWYSNANSFNKGLETALRYQVAGISIWVLGVEDPGVWDALSKLLE